LEKHEEMREIHEDYEDSKENARWREQQIKAVKAEQHREAMGTCLENLSTIAEYQLDEQQRHSEKPIHIPVCIVEGSSRKRHHVIAATAVGHLEGLHPRIEYPEVVVCGNECHDAGDGQSCAVAPCDIWKLKPEENEKNYCKACVIEERTK